MALQGPGSVPMPDVLPLDASPPSAAPTTDAALRVLVPPHIEGSPPPWGQVVHRLEGQTMGTTWSVLCMEAPAFPAASLSRLIQAVLDDVIQQMSTWEPDSVLSRFNRLPAGQSLVLPESFATVMDAALQIAALSGGAFDPSAGAMVNRWGFGPGPRFDAPGFQPPSPDDGGTAASSASWARLGWDPRERRLTQPGGLSLDLSAIAKGHAVDRLSTCLLEAGLPHHLVEIGGEVRGEGFKPEGMPWWVTVEPPAADLPMVSRVALHRHAIATSGDYRRHYRDSTGQRRSHTIDPRSGEPIAHGVASVSVLHPSAMWADGWSTALMVLGPEAGMKLAHDHGLAAWMLCRPPGDGTAASWQEHMTDAWRAWQE
jgi:FAD:protein FMN transferase